MIAQFLAPFNAFSCVYMSSLAALAAALYFALVLSEAKISARMALFCAACAGADNEAREDIADLVAMALDVADWRAELDGCIVTTRYEVRTAKDGRSYVVAIKAGARTKIVKWFRRNDSVSASAYAATLA